MRRFISFVGRVAPPMIRDAFGLIGCAAISYGVWEIYQPAGFIVAGAMMASGAWLLSAKVEA